MTTFDKFIIAGILSMIGIFVFNGFKLEHRIDQCEIQKGIMVNTPNGYRCLTKEDFK